MIFGPAAPVKARRVLAAVVVLALLSGLASAVSPPENSALAMDAAPLLVYGVGEETAIPETDDKNSGIRMRSVFVDEMVLAGIIAQEHVSEVALSLFDDVDFIVSIEHVGANALNTLSSSGRVLDAEYGYFLMSSDSDGRMLVQVDILDEGIAYIISEDPVSGQYRVMEHPLEDVRTATSSMPRIPPRDKDDAPPLPVVPVMSDRVTVDVLVAYTPAAEQWARMYRTGIDNVIASAIERGNLTLADSRVDLRLRLVHADRVNYTESGDAGVDLDRITFSRSYDPWNLDPQGIMDEVHDWRAEYGADLVVLLNSGFMGVAWLLTQTTGDPQFAFSVTPVEYADYILIHEIGHNLGCHHSRNQRDQAAPPEGGLFEYSTGWRWTGTNNRGYCSIMTYAEGDTAVYLFSNPEVSFAGAPSGSYSGPGAPADNARSIREIKQVVAGYLPTVVPEDDDEGDYEDEEDPAPNAIWYVNNANRLGTQNGFSWDTAFIRIQDAVTAASAGDDIWVAQGTEAYTRTGSTPVVEMKEGVRIYGGFAGNETERGQRSPSVNITVIDGENNRRAVRGANNAVLDGFSVFQGGMRNDGVAGLIVRNCRFESNTPAMDNTNSEISVRGCRFQGNADGMNNTGGEIEVLGGVFLGNAGAAINNMGAAISLYTSTFSYNTGGAMISADTLVDINHCRFESNQAAEGGALKNTNAILRINFSTFRRNKAIGGAGGAILGGDLRMRTVYLVENEALLDGGAIFGAEETSEIINCRFVRNSAGRQGGAMYIDADLRVVNALVYANRAESEGAGFANNGAAPRIWNTTFAANFGHALHNINVDSNPRVTNCIIWGNEAGILDAENNEPVVTYSNVQGGYTGDGNIDSDPLFRDLARGDLYLLESSPCINTGTASGAPNYDIIENPRGEQPDMGAWEYVGPDGGDAGEGGDGEPDEGEGEGEPPEEDTADFNAESLVRDKEGLLPLHDWVPLFRFTMSYGEDNFAPRYLSRMVYRLLNDPDDDDRNLDYAVTKDLHVTDLLEFGLFEDWYIDDDEAGEARYGTLSTDDYLLFTWDNYGRPVGSVSNLTYEMDFIGSGTSSNPQFPVETHPTIDDYKPDGNAYIVAVRTSATWRSQLSMGVELLFAEMIDPDTGQAPRNEDGELIDSYSPDFAEGDILEADDYYAASFGVYDLTGPDFSESPIPLVSNFADVPIPNFWQQNPYLSTPLSEFSRPRWNKPQQLMSIVAGEFMEIRNLLALDDWKALIGINLHSTRSFSTGDLESGGRTSILREVNVVLTDVGADPFGPPGNGGFNPRDALKPVRIGRYDDLEVGHHVLFNGLWVWQDMNGNGVFNPPTPNENGGASFNGDRPLPGCALTYDWEYVPLPPGGGDPWWKIKMVFCAVKDWEMGWLAPQPNTVMPIYEDEAINVGSEFTYDFFVVARLDSGYKDSSLQPATNIGATYGSEFRAFIEPRRTNLTTGDQTGGIFVTSQIPYEFDPYYGPWQNDPRWQKDEPWWPERTLNEKSAKPHKVGVEVFDLAHTYHSRSINMLFMPEFTFFPSVLIDIDLEVVPLLLGFSYVGGQEQSSFGRWLDPFQLDRRRFQNLHYPDVYSFVALEFALIGEIFGEPYRILTSGWGFPQFAFETRPFFDEWIDLPPGGPRSSAYPTPPGPLPLPDYSTWPAQLSVGEYPKYTDWAPKDSRARLLTQKIESNSKHVPILGFNMAGSADPIVNEEGNSVTVAEVNVAFWGPDFSPDILKPIDPKNDDNQSLDSGVLLWENVDETFGSVFMPVTFFNTQEVEYYGHTPLPMMHRVIPVTRLRWSGAPEYVDISGDGLPDDMDGDGIVDERDKAWVLTFRPRNQWELPRTDIMGDPSGGMDMYVTVSSSDALSRFQKFRAVVPATLPSRAEGRQRAGIQFYPPVNTSPSAFNKAHPEEDPVTPYFGHDMLEANVPMKIMDMTDLWTDIHIGGAPVPVLGLNISTNREDGTRASGEAGIGIDRGFHVAGARWTPDAFGGDFLIDRRYESYEIIGNTADTLTLLSGTPRSGAWRIVQEPTFLEEVTVEFYQEGEQASFNPLTDLLPLDVDQRISGVAIYRDNDNHPDNRNGMFDPDIDIPLTLDAPPRFVGRTAEEIKVRFVFSTPGASNFPRPRAEQPRNRQWVHDSFGYRVSDPESGADFFIVMRASNDMQLGDNFRVGIVSWGPNTPTEPDPHIWANLPGEDRHDYLKFREFPWGERGVGFITYFKNPPMSYFLHDAHASSKPDSSGYNWIRSHSAQKRRSGVITARNRPIGPRSLIIESVSQNRLPVQTLPGQGFTFIIYGKNFGNNPSVALSGYNVTVNSAKNEAISVTINTRPGGTPQEPVTLVVRNPNTGDEASRSDLFTLTSDFSAYGPKILGVNPVRGRKNDFPVIVEGENFFSTSRLEVRFGETLMPILDIAPDGRAITVGFPIGGLPTIGPLDVFVVAFGKNSGQDVKKDGFEYINPATRPKNSYFGCAPQPATTSFGVGDLALVCLTGLLLVFVGRRRRSCI